jgi:hypothetical protein
VIENLIEIIYKLKLIDNRLEKKEFILKLKNFSNLSENSFFLKNYFSFLLNEEAVVKIEQIYNALIACENGKNTKILVCIDAISKKNDLLGVLNFDSLTILYSIFLFKGVQRVSFGEGIYDINYLNSDIVLNNVYSNFNNFLIYYYGIKLSDEKKFKRETFKFIKILINKKIVYENIITNGERTLAE